MGRVSAMKAIKFVADGEDDLARYGLDKPRLVVTLRFSAREPLTLSVGAPTGEKDGEYALVYAKLGDEGTVYAVRDGILEEYAEDVEHFRLERFMRMDGNRVSRITATWQDTGRDADMNGTVKVFMAADIWQWEDGVPVPGSTPKRVASRAASVEADEFVAEASDDARWGFDKARATVRLEDLDGNVRTLLIGDAAPPSKDHEGNERTRTYARLAEAPEVYIIESGVLEVVRDLFHEHRRKANNDVAEDERHDQIEKEVGDIDKLHPPMPDRFGPPGRRPRPPDAPAPAPPKEDER
jgi:hypothetical protein